MVLTAQLKPSYRSLVVNLRIHGSSVFRYFAVGLLVLLALHMNAQFLHEHNLVEQGYTLIHVEPWNLNELPETVTFSHDGQKFYNTALCGIHFQINALQQLWESGFLLLLFLGLTVILRNIVFQTSNHPKTESLSSLFCRAPPALI